MEKETGPKLTLSELGVRIQSEQQYWSGYDPQLLEATCAAIRENEKEKEILKEKVRRACSQERGENRATMSWMSKALSILAGIALLAFVIASSCLRYEGSKANIEAAVTSAISNLELSKETLKKAGFSAISANGYHIYIKQVYDTVDE